eukprot:NODE_702_length_2167_cov_107.926125_g669_i0.p1 GENE.NODE_702_length_2167_cov_107.926125_g669_i0~~NODE_702_length_2167_cov_107.926125_g669_i0.p1  ORF type:complete len:485 (+),score=80.66 NODE_702_length_2167_cov_107.926125_g669_i0:66-1520(+)
MADRLFRRCAICTVAREPIYFAEDAPACRFCMRPKPAGGPAVDPEADPELTKVSLEIIALLDSKWDAIATPPGEVPAEAFEWTDDELDCFCDMILLLCMKMKEVLAAESYPLLRLSSPMCVLGDIHGSFDDLQFFVRELCPTIQEPFPKPTAKPEKKALIVNPNAYVLLGGGRVKPIALGALEDSCTPSHRASRGKDTADVRKLALKNALGTASGGHDPTSLDSGGLLLLGDYVDRGFCDVEVAAYVLALKGVAPKRVHLLRGNHETAVVNSRYGFQTSCNELFGDDGNTIWTTFNEVFSHLPLAAILDGRVFCAHAGIPRTTLDTGADDRLKVMEKTNWDLVRSGGIPNTPVQARQLSRQREMLQDLLWADPSDPDAVLNADGFGDNSANRGPGTWVFGAQAIETFFRNHDFELILRAHQAKASGFQLQKAGKVLTVFSSSRYCGDDNTAAGLFINGNSVQIYTRVRHQSRSRAGSMDGGEHI